jgi:hypothetical protein
LKGWKHGARVIEITHNEFGTRTWLRLEDGSIEIQKQHSRMLNYFYFILLFIVVVPVSWRKFVGCCSMEGHGRVAMTWLNLLFLLFYIIAFSLIIFLLVRASVRMYAKHKSKSFATSLHEEEIGGEEEQQQDGVLHTWEIRKLSHLWSTKAPQPRQRRVNEWGEAV